MTLGEYLSRHPELAVALSGGVDSAVLLAQAARYCQRVGAYFVHTPFQPAFELADAQAAAAKAGAALTVIPLDILSIPEAAANPPDRCYYCKRTLFSAILRAAANDGYLTVADGCNASDDASDRPGMRALAELSVCSPLRDCGLTKADVRRLARELDLAVWDKPSYACLATRIPTGTPITAEALARAEAGEAYLMALGFTDFRLRLRGPDGLWQVTAAQYQRAQELLPEVRRHLAASFRTVELDPIARKSRES